MDAVLYTDLNCPFCYATETRLEALGAIDRIEWRGVEHEPDLPVPMLRDDADLADELSEEVGQVRARAPDVDIAVPAGKPNTARAILMAVAAARVDPERGRAFRQAMYRALWVRGVDLSLNRELGALAGEHGLESIDPRPEDDMRVTDWALDWQRSPLRGVPLLVRSDGEVLYGLKDAQELARFMNVS